MAFDGIVIANLVHDIRQKLEGGKINKIAQPEKDELMFTVKIIKKPCVSRYRPAQACPWYTSPRPTSQAR